MSEPTTHAPLPDLHARAPIDRVAARVTGKGEQWNPNKRVNQPMLVAPPATRPAPPDLEDLSGRRIGRLTVIGLSLPAGKKGRWVMRCDCGMYVLRRTSAIRNEENAQDACEYCRHLAHLKRAERYRRIGKYDDE